MSMAGNTEPNPHVPDPFFKGWAKPGPIPPGALDAKPAIAEGETLDAISGHFRLFQFRTGHRFSTDDVLTAWYGTSWCPSARTVLDLGSGIGSVGMIAAWRLPGARFVTIEAQDESVRLARKSAAYNGLGECYEIRHGDFRDDTALRPDEKFDLVLGSPPYFPLGTGIRGRPIRRKSPAASRCAAILPIIAGSRPHDLASGGLFACVFPNDQMRERVESSAHEAALTIVRRRLVVLKEGNPPLLCHFGMMRAEHLPESFRGQTWTEPPLVFGVWNHYCLDIGDEAWSSASRREDEGKDKVEILSRRRMTDD